MIIRCSCKHPFQDATYGAGNRVGTKMPTKPSGNVESRCTVCNKVHHVGQVAVKTKAKKGKS